MLTSVLVCQSKVFEDIMVDQLMQFLDDKICDLLLEYIKEYSNWHSLLHVIEEYSIQYNSIQYFISDSTLFYINWCIVCT